LSSTTLSNPPIAPLDATSTPPQETDPVGIEG